MQHQTRLERVLALLCSVLDAYSAVLFLPVKGETPAVYRMAASFSLGNLLNPEAEQAEGRGLVGWILRAGEPLLVSDFDRKRNQLGYYADGEERHIKAFMGCALPGARMRWALKVPAAGLAAGGRWEAMINGKTEQSVPLAEPPR